MRTPRLASAITSRVSGFRPLRLSLAIGSLLVGGLGFLPANASQASTLAQWIQATPDTQKQRNEYIAASTYLQKGQRQAYQQHLARLQDYPLLPYLEYEDISRQIQTYPTAKVDQFLSRYGKSYLGEKLQKKWLYTLAAGRRWADVVRFYNPEVTDTELTCQWLYARTTQGDSTAYAEVGALWNVGRSQPKGCDSLFQNWIKKGGLTTDLAWSRYSQALRNHNDSLAKYLTRYLSPSQLPLAELYRQVDKDPSVLQQTSRFERKDPAVQEIILHGVRQLSRKDPMQAFTLWQTYDASNLFADAPRREAIEYLALRLIDANYIHEAEQVTASIPGFNTTYLAESMIRRYLRDADWPKVATWIGRLPADQQATPGWRYWLARSLEMQKKSTEDLQTAQKLYQELASERSFYGFLASDRLGASYAFQDKPVDANQAQLDAIANKPEMRRARELLAMNQDHLAQREWFYMAKSLTPAEHMAAAKLAQSWGWHRNGIIAMASAKAWDDLDIRFPIVYRDHVQTAARKHKLEQPLLFAIARQESAFAVDAMSPAGALGLMQLMPATAKYTANKAGLSYKSKYDLLQADKNIALGSFYIDELLNRFNGNRILAAAAYNAGPTRVKQWLNDDQNKLPYDVWIETIPFRETRGYVQNILSYSVIYGYRLGSPQPVITAKEAAQKL